ncbi:unnamed protein product [Oreochromis niloticus]|nr:unnamed protein product [Mustela putorius furo]
MEDEVRAKVLLSAVHELNTYLYQDLVEQGPQGKTERTLTQLKLTGAAELMIGSTLPRFQRAVRERSFLDKITTVDDAGDFMVQERLILPDEEYMLYYMCDSTEGKAAVIKNKVDVLRKLFGCPTVPDEAKDSISLILAVYNLHAFGIFPERWLETVTPQAGASVV